VSAIVRLAKDPNAPEALRDALDKAATETASPEVLLRVLGAAGAGAGAALTIAAHAARTGPRLVGMSAATKGVAAFAIFAAGAVAGGYAVHEHDARQFALADAATPPGYVDRGSSFPSRVPSDGFPETPPSEAAAAPVVASAGPGAMPETAPPSASPPRPVREPARARTPRFKEHPAPAESAVPPSAAPLESPTRSWTPSSREELVSLRGIRDAIDGDRPAEALAAIEGHRAKYPDSVFDQELLLLEAQARWARLDASACASLDRFALQYPRSLLIARVQALRAEARCR
jgi:hypothetical protein